MAYVENCNANAQFQCSETQKNVFLIGDSIRQGYCATVKEELSQKAREESKLSARFCPRKKDTAEVVPPPISAPQMW